MFLPYLKRTGDIVTPIIMFETDLDIVTVFGDKAEDYSEIYDYINVPNDEYVMKNTDKFRVNIETRQLEMKKEAIPKYPITTE